MARWNSKHGSNSIDNELRQLAVEHILHIPRLKVDRAVQ